MVNWAMTRMDWIERVSAAVIGLGLIIWVPQAYGGYRTSRIINGYDVRDTFDVRRVSVGDAVAGDPVHLDVDRTIHAAFNGSYTVEVRTFPQRTVVCVAGDQLRYDPGAFLPENLTLHWWANDGECDGSSLSPGRYIVVTSWMIENQISEVRDQTVTVESNPFTIVAVSPEEAVETVEGQAAIQAQIQLLERQIELLQSD